MEASNTGPGNDAQLATAGLAVPDPSAAVAAQPAAAAAAKPDITKAQLVGAVPIVAKLLSAFGVYTLTGAQQEALTLALGGGAALFVADAVIRFGRNLNKH